MMNHFLTDFRFDGWTAEQYEYCSRAAFAELKRRGIAEPYVDYAVALAWHRRHHRGAALIPGMLEAT
jgi:hypothetical protein